MNGLKSKKFNVIWDEVSLKRVNSTKKFLGIIIDENLTWKKSGLKKKDVCLPFSDQPQILENKGHLFFLFVILNFAFLNKIFKIKCQNI